MSGFVIIKIGDGYLHYNPSTSSYYIGEGKLGLATFYRDNAINFINMTKIKDYTLETVSDNVKITHRNRESEHKVYKATHT